MPDAVTDGAVDRERLRARRGAPIPDLLAAIEARIHPLVAADRAAFAARARRRAVVVFDIPLLFETGAERGLDGVLVVTARSGRSSANGCSRGRA